MCVWQKYAHCDSELDTYAIRRQPLGAVESRYRNGGDHDRGVRYEMRRRKSYWRMMSSYIYVEVCWDVRQESRRMVLFMFARCSLSRLMSLVFQFLYEVMSFTPAVVSINGSCVSPSRPDWRLKSRSWPGKGSSTTEKVMRVGGGLVGLFWYVYNLYSYRDKAGAV